MRLFLWAVRTYCTVRLGLKVVKDTRNTCIASLQGIPIAFTRSLKSSTTSLKAACLDQGLVRRLVEYLAASLCAPHRISGPLPVTLSESIGQELESTLSPKQGHKKPSAMVTESVASRAPEITITRPEWQRWDDVPFAP